jgi:hypothetical protein
MLPGCPEPCRPCRHAVALHGATVLPLGLAWAGYGFAAFALRDFNSHYLAFVACGAALLVALALPRVR